MSRTSLYLIAGEMFGLSVAILLLVALILGGIVITSSERTVGETNPAVVESDTMAPVLYGVDVYATAVPVEQEIAVSVTAVQYIVALQDVNIHSGPTTEYDVVGWIAEGQIAKITGANKQTGWWRVMCPDETVGSCWVPSDTQITHPTQPPVSAQAEVSSLP